MPSLGENLFDEVLLTGLRLLGWLGSRLLSRLCCGLLGRCRIRRGRLFGLRCGSSSVGGRLFGSRCRRCFGSRLFSSRLLGRCCGICCWSSVRGRCRIGGRSGSRIGGRCRFCRRLRGSILLCGSCIGASWCDRRLTCLCSGIDGSFIGSLIVQRLLRCLGCGHVDCGLLCRCSLGLISGSLLLRRLGGSLCRGFGLGCTLLAGLDLSAGRLL